MINLNSEPGGDVFTRNGADALTRYDAATGQVLQTITWGSQFYPYYCCWMGSFLAYDLKRRLLYIFNPAYNKAPDSATAPNQGFGVLYRLNSQTARLRHGRQQASIMFQGLRAGMGLTAGWEAIKGLQWDRMVMFI